MKLYRIVVTVLAVALALGLGSGHAVAAQKAAKAQKAATAQKASPASKVNLNTATVDQLAALPGVGAKLAARIVEHRQKEGGFKSAQELMNVKGIGEKNFQRMQSYLSVGDAPARSGSSR